MKIHYVKAMIERDAVEKIPVCVLATEIPVLQMVHKGKLTGVEVQDDFLDIDPVTEFDRLEGSYGVREGVGRSFAEEVYGSAHGLSKKMFVGDDSGPEADDDEPVSAFPLDEDDEVPATTKRGRKDN